MACGPASFNWMSGVALRMISSAFSLPESVLTMQHRSEPATSLARRVSCRSMRSSKPLASVTAMAQAALSGPCGPLTVAVRVARLGPGCLAASSGMVRSRLHCRLSPAGASCRANQDRQLPDSVKVMPAVSLSAMASASGVCGPVTMTLARMLSRPSCCRLRVRGFRLMAKGWALLTVTAICAW